MTGEFWQYAVPAVAATVATVVTVMVAARGTNRRVADVHQLAAPTGNGFAAEVRTALQEIQVEQNRQALHLARMEGAMSALLPPARWPQGDDGTEG